MTSDDLSARLGDLIGAPHQFFQTLVEHIPAIVYLAPADDPGNVEYVSPPIQRILGFDQESWLEQPTFWKDRLHPDDRELVLASDAEAVEHGEGYDVRYRLQHRDGHYVWIRDRATLVRASDGTPRFWLGLTFDITNLKQVEDALLSAEERYRTLVEQFPAVTFTFGMDASQELTYVSPQVEEMFGYSREEWQSDRQFWLSVIHPDDLQGALDNLRQSMDSGEKFRHEYRLVASDGRTMWVQNDASLVRDADGTPIFWLGVMLDITDRKQAEEALRAAESRYRTLVEQIPVVTYVEPHDGKGIPSYISPQIQDVLGYSTEYWREHPDIGARSIHPDDVSAWEDALARSDETGERFDLTYRMITADGRMIWVRSAARLVGDETTPGRFWQGTIQDITDAVLADQRLAESEQRYRSLFDHNPDPVYSFDLEGTLTSANQALSELTGYSHEELLGTAFQQLIVPEDLPLVERCFRNAVAGQPQSYETRGIHKDGTLLDFHVTNLPIIVGGEIVGVYGVAKDISERKKLERQLEHMAFHDWLTGLANRVLFMDRLRQTLAGFRRRPGTLAVLFVDLDNFKTINDTAGHDVGDLVLVEAAVRIQRCIRAGDTAARLGGDEFTILLKDVGGYDDAVDVAQRILNEFSEPWQINGHQIALTTSAGIVLSSSPDDDPDVLIRRGDMAMYRAKAAGKARYVIFQEPDLDAAM